MNKELYEIAGDLFPNTQFLLSPEAIQFLITLEQFTRERRYELLNARKERQKKFDAGEWPDFLDSTKDIRIREWSVQNTPDDLQDRRVEITGPVDRKMIINALNSGAQVFMADFEDSNAPTWQNGLEGQANLYDAVRKTISYDDPQSNKHYKLNERHAVLMVRPRGWHLDEAHVLIDGQPISASLFDALLYLFHNADELMAQGTGVYFYLPKMESHLEARLWNDVLTYALQLLNLPRETIKITVLIETITAAFEMDEIIYELRDYIVGLNCGRWDYIFSFIKKFRNHADCVLPDRQQVTMTRHFLQSYVTLLIRTCHRRGIHAMGGMAAQIPIKGNEQANEEALNRVFLDKQREALAGHDGTWVAHPGLIPVALEAFNEVMPQANQLNKPLTSNPITQQDLLAVPDGEITETGVRNNISVALLYLKSWLMGNGCVPIRHLMEDAATAEICRAQLWQWLKFSVTLNNGLQLNQDLLHTWLDDEFNLLMRESPEVSDTNALTSAKELLQQMIFNTDFYDFITLPAYSYLINIRTSK